jgi:hypothetical protein
MDNDMFSTKNKSFKTVEEWRQQGSGFLFRVLYENLFGYTGDLIPKMDQLLDRPQAQGKKLKTINCE